jgi:hypothetical protein
MSCALSDVGAEAEVATGADATAGSSSSKLEATCKKMQ